MFKKTAKNIAIALNVFMLLQLASLGMVQSVSAKIRIPEDPSVTKLELVEADTSHGDNYGEITNGKVFNISVLREDEFSVLATTNPQDLKNGSVRFELNGVYRNENSHPYYLNGNHYNFVYEVDELTVGEYSLTATPYTGQNGTGTAGVAKSVSFSIIDNPEVTRVSLSDKVIKDSDAGRGLDIFVDFSEDMNSHYYFSPKLYVGETLLSDSEYGTSLVCQAHGYRYQHNRSFWWDDNTYKFDCEMRDADVELPATGLTIKGARGDHRPYSMMIPYKTTKEITVDTKNPVLTIETKATNDTTPSIFGTVDDVKANVKVRINGHKYEADVDSMTGTWIAEVDETLDEGKYIVIAKAKDANCNRAEVTSELEVDITAPMKASGLKADYLNGKVVLSWANPTEEYAGLKIVKVSDNDTSEIVLTDKTAISFSDENVVPGKSYSYKVVVMDRAGNSSVSDPATVFIPVPPVKKSVTTSNVTSNQIASAAISDSAAATISADDNTPAETEEVKAEETKDEDNEEGLPFWGLLLLILLAGVGAYLFYAQKPKEMPPVAAKNKKEKGGKK